MSAAVSMAGCGSGSGSTATSVHAALSVPDERPVSPDELEAELEPAVRDGDLCGFNRIFATNRLPAGSDDYVPTLEVFADALADIAPTLDDSIRPAVDVLVEQTHQIVARLRATDGDTSDSLYLDIQKSSAAQDAQRTFTEWVDRNCATTGTSTAG